MLVPESEGLSFPQLPHKNKGGPLKVIPLLGHLEGREQPASDLCLWPPRRGGAMALPHHFQQVLLQRLHSGERLHLQHAARPVDQSRLTWRSLQTETQPPRQDLRSGREPGLSLSFRRHTGHSATF